MVRNIRPFTIADIPFYNSVRNECSEFLHDSSKYTLPDTYKWFKSYKSPFFIYEIDNQSVGYFRTSNWEENSCFVGMDIHRDYRGKKLAQPAYKLFFDYLFNQYSIDIFFLEVLEKNIRAMNLYSKLGFIILDSYITVNKEKSYLMQLYEN